MLFDVLTGVAMLLVRGAQWWNSARHLIVKNMSITAASAEGARLSRVVVPPPGVSNAQIAEQDTTLEHAGGLVTGPVLR